MPSLWPYLQRLNGSQEFLPFVVASYSVGEAVGAVGFGFASKKWAIRPLLLTSVALATLASVLYCMAEPLEFILDGVWSVLFARLLQGVASGGQQAMEQTWVSESIAPEERTRVTGQLSAFSAAGFVLGPVIGAPLAHIDFRFELLVLDGTTAPGWIVVVAFLSMLGTTWMWFRDERSLLDNEHTLPFLAGENIDIASPRIQTSSLYPINSIGIFVCFVAFFVHFAGFAIQETITTLLVKEMFGWDEERAFYLFAAAGVLSIFSFVALHFLSGKVNDVSLLLSSVAIGLAGYVCLIPWHESYNMVQFLGGFALISIAFPLGRALVLSVFSQVIGPDEQGSLIGQLFAVGAIARITGPFWAVDALVYWGPKVIFGGTAIVFAVSLVLQVFSWTCLQPRKVMRKVTVTPIPQRTHARAALRQSPVRDG